MTPYRTLVFARIVQESALNVGGNRPHGLVDSPLARDGRGRPVIRGSTLAGCFIASARALSGKLPGSISSPTAQENELQPSVWRFAHAHPLGDEPSSGYYQHVSIDPRTQAAKDDHLFNLEAMPAGTTWSFELEIAPATDTDFDTLEALAAAVLEAWRQPGGARLGRGSRHGYGWCHLEQIAIIRLDSRHTRVWPDAFAPDRTPCAWVEYFRSRGAEILDLPDFIKQHDNPPPQSSHAVVQLCGMIEVGERTDDFGRGYGLDTLSIGGHSRMQLQAGEFFQRVIAPPNIPFSENDFDPDFVITAMPGISGALEPYVPGASIRGVWRSQLTRHYQAVGGEPDLIDALFGTTDRAGSLSVADATLADDDWRLLWQQHVAIDELTGGAFGSNKFDRLCIANARFRWRARVEAESQQEAERLAAPLRALLTSLGEGHLPLGGGIWRGHGHIRWTLDACLQETVNRESTRQGDTP